MFSLQGLQLYNIAQAGKLLARAMLYEKRLSLCVERLRLVYASTST
jgi:hypothetical protein